MKLKTKIIATTSLVFIVFICTSSWLEFVEIRNFSRERILAEARHIKGLMMSTRFVYHHQFLDSGLPLNDNTLGFLPAHALSKISQHFSKDQTNYITFNNVSTDPRNPYNEADSVETRVCAFFSQNPDQDEYFALIEDDLTPFYQYATPIWTQPYCLNCHGTFDEAPITIQQRYTSGFNYSEGDLRGIISVRIPVQQSQQFILAQLKSNLPVVAGSLCSLFILLYLLVQKTIVIRLEKLLLAANNIRRGHYQQTLQVQGNDEICQLTTDISRMAQAIETRENSLRKSQSKLANAQRIAHLGNWEWDRRSDSLLCSDETYRIFGWDYVGKKVSYRKVLRDVHPEDRPKLSQYLRDALHGHPFSDLEIKTREHNRQSCFIRIRAEVEQTAESLYLAGTVQDITQAKEVEHQIRDLNQSLEGKVKERTEALMAANRELEAFSYSVSHDLRAPLRAISGFSQILMEDYSSELSEDAHRYLKLVADNSRTMGTLIDDLLRFSRINRHPLQKQHIDMKQLAEQILRELEEDPGYHHPRRDITLGTLPSCYGDPALIKQVLTNLLSNAMKFSLKQDHPHIEFSTLHCDNGLAYFVRDNGAGFDMKYANKLFGVFQRLHHQDEFSGTGVGLATVQRIISRHGGRIWAEAALNEGATFYFTLEGAME